MRPERSAFCASDDGSGQKGKHHEGRGAGRHPARPSVTGVRRLGARRCKRVTNPLQVDNLPYMRAHIRGG